MFLPLTKKGHTYAQLDLQHLQSNKSQNNTRGARASLGGMEVMFIYKNACAVFSPRHPFTDDVTYSHNTRLPAVTPPSQDPRPTTASELLKWSGRGHWFQMVQVDLFPFRSSSSAFGHFTFTTLYGPLYLAFSFLDFPSPCSWTCQATRSPLFTSTLLFPRAS